MNVKTPPRRSLFYKKPKKIMKKILLTLFSALILSGCSTTYSLKYADPNAVIPKEATFEVGTVADTSGFDLEKAEGVNLTKEFTDKLQQALKKEGIQGSEYKLNVRIVQYAPGNALGRWFLGVTPRHSSATTIMKTWTKVVNSKGEEVAEMDVERVIGSGGLASVGAWRTVIEDVAVATVQSLKEELEKQKDAKKE